MVLVVCCRLFSGFDDDPKFPFVCISIRWGHCLYISEHRRPYASFLALPLTQDFVDCLNPRDPSQP